MCEVRSERAVRRKMCVQQVNVRTPSIIRDCLTVASALPTGEEFVGIEELCTVIANFGAAFGIECSLSRNSSGSPPACGRCLFAGYVNVLTDDVASQRETSLSGDKDDA